LGLKTSCAALAQPVQEVDTLLAAMSLKGRKHYKVRRRQKAAQTKSPDRMPRQARRP